MTDRSAQMDRDYGFLAQKLLALAPQAGFYHSDMPNVRYARRSDPGRRESVLYPPCIGLIVQGASFAQVGADEYCFPKGRYLLCSADMPSSFKVSASPEEPFLALIFKLDAAIFAEIFREMDVMKGISRGEGDPASADAESDGFHGYGAERCLRVSDATPELVGALARLADLIDQPEKAHFLAPCIVREIHYYLASGPDGEFLRSFFASSSQSGQIAHVVHYMREHCYERLRIEKLAAVAGMAESTFNRNFKKVTSLSPLQYHKQIKLYEAKRLMMFEKMSAAQACTTVGYESQQQFTREYKRLFGTPPMRDVKKLGRPS